MRLLTSKVCCSRVWSNKKIYLLLAEWNGVHHGSGRPAERKRGGPAARTLPKCSPISPRGHISIRPSNQSAPCPALTHTAATHPDGTATSLSRCPHRTPHAHVAAPMRSWHLPYLDRLPGAYRRYCAGYRLRSALCMRPFVLADCLAARKQVDPGDSTLPRQAGWRNGPERVASRPVTAVLAVAMCFRFLL